MMAAVLTRYRVLIAVLIFLLIAGSYAMTIIAKEDAPDIQVPFVYVSAGYDGISARDADQLLVRPIDRQLRGIDGVKEIKSTAVNGHASVFIEFASNVDITTALQDVRERVDRAVKDLPKDADTPTVHEINIGLFPVLVVTLSGEVDENTLLAVAKDLQDRIETLPNVLEAELVGAREEIVEVVIDPTLLEGLGLSIADAQQLVSGNNQIIAAGTVDSSGGRLNITLPGLIEDIDAILNLPIQVKGDRVIRVRDVAFIKRGFKDAQTVARFDGKPAFALEITKRLGTNVIETIDEVKTLVAATSAYWPDGVTFDFSQDQSANIERMLVDLYNNIVVATIIVMLIVLCFLGIRSALLVGLTIPGAFLTAVFVLYLFGFTLNIVVLFSLILSIGMLVDGAIVINEHADRSLARGKSHFTAFVDAPRLLGWPVIASTLTTLAVFMPLMFWPDIIGEFMRYLPLTLIITLSASLLMALCMIPAVGILAGNIRSRVFGEKKQADTQTVRNIRLAEDGDLTQLTGAAGLYARVLRSVVLHPLWTLLGAITLFVGSILWYSSHNHGVEFFPDIEPERAYVAVQARGNMGLAERDATIRTIEHFLLSLPELHNIYTVTSGDTAEEEIGRIHFEFVPWDMRRPAQMIFTDIRKFAETVVGVKTEVHAEKGGPSSSADVTLEITGHTLPDIYRTLDMLHAIAAETAGLINVRNDRSAPNIEWELTVDREQASRFGVSVASVGAIVRLATGGVKVGAYRPSDSDDEVDILLRFPDDYRNADYIGNLHMPVGDTLVPISNVMRGQPVPIQGAVKRIDGNTAHLLLADKTEDVQTDKLVKQLQARIEETQWPAGVEFKFSGEAEDQARTGSFLSKAFTIAIFAMFLILLVQFNRVWHSLIILSAIVFSTVGVLWGLLLTGKPFGIVMCGVGVIALAGIVVNNNIVLIDAFRQLHKRGLHPIDAAIRAGVQRMRPVLLTSLTTVLGLLPMVYQITIDLFAREVAFGAPSSQWWVQLSTSIAGGLTFATLITLFFTPAMLVVGKVRAYKKEKRQAQAAEI